jgi:hypothetical protein
MVIKNSASLLPGRVAQTPTCFAGLRNKNLDLPREVERDFLEFSEGATVTRNTRIGIVLAEPLWQVGRG